MVSFVPSLLIVSEGTNTGSGTLALKTTQGFFNETARPRVVEKYGCLVMEVQDWIDAINQPEWQREKRQIFGLAMIRTCLRPLTSSPSTRLLRPPSTAPPLNEQGILVEKTFFAQLPMWR